MTNKEAIDKLYSLQLYGVKLGLDNIKLFMGELNNPEKKLKVFHVAGSNGKGSTSSFIASILMEAGYKVGLYTSPHFVRFNERIKINGKEINDENVREFVEKYEEFIFKNHITFFEAATALAFDYFQKNNVDYAVIETGLGGRLDATNVVNPLASVITSISLEHTNILGSSIDSITKEKAGIIKPNTSVFVGKLPQESISIIEKICNELKCELFLLEDYINLRGDEIELYTEEINFNKLKSPLPGAYQLLNAALAGVTVYKTIGISVPSVLKKGIEHVITNTGISGRFEYVKKNPDIILDSAHNFEGVENFINEFKKRSKQYKKKFLLFSVLHDKSFDLMLLLLKHYFDEIYFYELKNERALTIDELKSKQSVLDIDFKYFISIEEAMNEFNQNSSKDDCLVVLGSMYLIGDMKSYLEKNT